MNGKVFSASFFHSLKPQDGAEAQHEFFDLV